MSSDDSTLGRPKIPDEDLEAEFHRVASLDEVDGTPTILDMEEYGKHSARVYANRFDGGWNAAVSYYGYETNSLGGRISDEQLEADFHEFAEELAEDRGPTQTEMDDEGPHSASTYRLRIGGQWNDVLAHYGYGPNKRSFVYSVEEVREILQFVAIETERPPEPEDIPEDVRKDILKRWGSWWVAQEMCGVTEYDLEMAFADGGDEE